VTSRFDHQRTKNGGRFTQPPNRTFFSEVNQKSNPSSASGNHNTCDPQPCQSEWPGFWDWGRGVVVNDRNRQIDHQPSREAATSTALSTHSFPPNPTRDQSQCPNGDDCQGAGLWNRRWTGAKPGGLILDEAPSRNNHGGNPPGVPTARKVRTCDILPAVKLSDSCDQPLNPWTVQRNTSTHPKDRSTRHPPRTSCVGRNGQSDCCLARILDNF